ncbi:Sugar/inositol transporter [Parasponia andersonii]|uniref:Sugar/inositol transporter n=1 Tax=Parasponia andersonii TaxID=3476 RepID=A0A2P5D1D4_PARAD|nr:Sugar/inositol transporter [Parasponia andersonii]
MVGLAIQKAEPYQGKVTAHLIVTCVIASIGGFIFGYVGIPGGLTLNEGIADLYEELVYSNEHYLDHYCRDGAGMDAGYLPPLYIPGIIASLIASPVTRKYGRRRSIIISGVCFGIGAALIAIVPQIVQYGPDQLGILVGRVIAGLGIGFGTQAIPLYLSEIAPAQFRGGFSFMFQLAIALGILIANIVNYVTRVPEERRWTDYKGITISFGMVAFLAFLMTVGVKFLPETPNSLIQRGSEDKGRHVLQKLRGTENVEAEVQDIVAAGQSASTVKRPFISIFWKRNRPQLVMAILMPMFQALAGINSLLYYASILLRNMGFGEKASFYSSLMIGAALVSSTLLSMGIVDRLGRRALLISGGILMIICQVIIAVILKGKLGDHQHLSKSLSILVMVLICISALAFGWSWGPLGWTIPSEIFPLEVRSAGQSITVAVNLLFTLLVADSFLPLLCPLRFGLFLFYAGCITASTVFVYLFLPETNGVPIEEMACVWTKHWFWKKIVPAQHGQTLP